MYLPNYILMISIAAMLLKSDHSFHFAMVRRITTADPNLQNNESETISKFFSEPNQSNFVNDDLATAVAIKSTFALINNSNVSSHWTKDYLTGVVVGSIAGITLIIGIIALAIYYFR
ncbi:hypothetical protein GJ496_008351 [Pomphorhynchus laevis]|nr:hypothetical protein GJ496_008351 [Pomphorhynchus laevis]